MHSVSRRRATALLFAGVLPPVVTAAPKQGRGRHRASDRGLVYHLTKEGTQIWVGGSLHRLRRSDHPLPAPYEAAYRESRRLHFEVSRDELTRPGFRRDVASAREWRDGRSLETELPEDLWREVLAHAKRLRVSSESIRSMRPWFAAWHLMEAAYDSHGIRVDSGIEETFHSRAARDGRRIGGLDEPKALIAGLQMDPPGADDGVKVLRSTLRQLKRAPAVYAGMIAVWRRGDEAEIERTFGGVAATAGLSRRAPVAERNRRWIRRIDRNRKEFEGSLILPGISHIPGAGGLLSGLVAKGWKAERLG